MSAKVSFQLVDEQGWRRGFANMMRKENGEWWRTRRWLVQALIWLLLVNGITALTIFNTAGTVATADGQLVSAASVTPEMAVMSGMNNMSIVAGLFAAVGVIIAMQGAILDEKKSGTAAWIASKPVSRAAFVISKLVANSLALVLIILVVQGAVAYGLFAIRGYAPALLPYIFGLVLLGINMMFYISLTLMLGSLSNDRAAIIALPLAAIFIGQMLLSWAPGVAYFAPWMLIFPSEAGMALSFQAMTGATLSTVVPVLATIGWIVLFVYAAIWRYRREEF